MKKQIMHMVAIAALTAGSLAAFAQDSATTPAPNAGQTAGKGDRGERREEMRARHMQRMAQELNLTEAQKTQLKSLHEQQRAQMEALKNEALTVDQRRAKMKELHTSFKTQTQAILTPEQQAKMQELKQKRGGKRGKHGRGHGRHGDGNHGEGTGAPPSTN